MSSTALAIIAPEPVKIELIQARRHSEEYLAASRSRATMKSYRCLWEKFSTWCADMNLPALPAESQTVADYVSARAQAGLKAGSIGVTLSAIAKAHRSARLPNPCADPLVVETVKGIRRTHGTRQQGKRPIMTDELLHMLQHVRKSPNETLARRDKAILLLCFMSAMRRSELVALDTDDVVFSDSGVTLHIRKSKTDQEGQGQDVAVPFGHHAETCAVRALKDWLEASGIESGAIFRIIHRSGNVMADRLSGEAVLLVCKKYAELAGLPADEIGAHSLRSGFCTSAWRAGVQESRIMRQTRHQSLQMVHKYIRPLSLFEDNPAAALNL